MHYAKPKLLIIDELGYLPFERIHSAETALPARSGL
jgi:DNA replication protein DnaC